jgi:hypothetical protein
MTTAVLATTPVGDDEWYLRHVLPWPSPGEGGHIIISHTKGRGHWADYAVTAPQAALPLIRQLAGDPSVLGVFASQGRMRNKKRAKQDVTALTSVYLDLDLKNLRGEGDEFLSPRERLLRALRQFCKATGLPYPSTTIWTGGGVHAFWLFASPIPPEEWVPLARKLRDAAADHGLPADLQVTTDAARVLRVPATYNRKPEYAQPQEVAIVFPHDRAPPIRYSPKELEALLSKYVSAQPSTSCSNVVHLPEPSPSVLAKFAGLENDLSAGIDSSFPPIKLTEIASECAFVAEAIKTKGAAYTNPMWNLTTLISTFCEGERADAHLMGSGHPGYTEESTDALYDRKVREKNEKGLGWPSCSAISAAGCTACQSCKHFSKGKSPLNVARSAPRLVSGIRANDNRSDPLRFTSLPLKEAIARINTEFLVLRSSGKIYRQDVDGEINAVAKHDFKTALGGRWVTFDKNGEVTRRAAADAWLDDAERREYRGFRYSPNNIGLRSDHLNLWTGWGDVISVEGDCSIVVEHILNIVADGDQAKCDFFLDWIADILQNPTRKPGVAPVLRGGQGSGKSVVPAIVRTVIGPKNVLTVNDKERMLSRFNSAVMNKILVVGEEMLFARDHATTDKLKHFVTGQTLPVEFKFGDALEIESYHRLLLTSNHEQVIQAAGEERRFVIYDVSDAQRGDADYFDRLYAVADGRDNGTASAFKYFLLHRNLEKFRPWQEQQCFASDAALTTQKQLSLSAPLAWLQEVMDTVVGQGNPGDYDWIDGLPYQGTQYSPSRESKWPPRFPRSQAVAAFRAWATKAKPFGVSEFTGSPERFWADVCKVIPRPQTNRQTSNGVRTVCIDLADLQNNFQRYLRGEIV